MTGPSVHKHVIFILCPDFLLDLDTISYYCVKLVINYSRNLSLADLFKESVLNKVI